MALIYPFRRTGFGYQAIFSVENSSDLKRRVGIQRSQTMRVHPYVYGGSRSHNEIKIKIFKVG